MALVIHNQSLIDVAVQHTGSAENLFQLAVLNGKSITDDLVPGEEIAIDSSINIDEDIFQFFQNKKLRPATGEVTEPTATPELEGISYWIINKNFIVQ